MREPECEREYLKEKEAIEERDHKHDESLEELKALVQELTAKLIETERELKDLREHIDNGWRNDFITQVVSQVLELLKATGMQFFQLNTQKEKTKSTTMVEFLKIVGTVAATIVGFYFVK